jgi:hypothetical protein
MTMTDNVIAMPTPLAVLADRIRENDRRVEQNATDWLDLMVERCTLLHEARSRFGSDDRAFGRWIADNDLAQDLSPQDRMAAVSFGAHPDRAREVFASKKREMGFRYLWDTTGREVFKDASIAKVAIDSSKAGMPAEKPAQAPQEAATAPSAADKKPITNSTSAPVAAAAPSSPVTAEAFSRSPLRNHKRAHDVLTYYTDQTTRGSLARVHKGAGWPLILQVIDLGVFRSSPLGVARPTGRLLCPVVGLSRADALILGDYDLSSAADCRRAEREVMPFIRAHGADLQADPANFRALWTAFRRKADGPPPAAAPAEPAPDAPAAPAPAAPPAAASDEQKRLDDHVAHMLAGLQARPNRAFRPSHEGPIRHCGVEIWPAREARYSFEQAWYAYQLWKDISDVLRQFIACPKSRALRLSNPFLPIMSNINPAVGDALQRIVRAQEGAPDQLEDSACPPKELLMG